MRKLIFAINLTLDGCCDHTKLSGDADILAHFGQFLQNVDLIIYGRKTYGLMVPYWPDIAREQTESPAEIEYARIFDAVPKLVFSRTLNSVDDKNSSLAQNDLISEVAKLKQLPGKPISVGGVALPAQLLAAGLIDEFHIVVHPIIAGKGRRLFDDVDLHENTPLRLVTSKQLPGGRMALDYEKVGS